MVDTDDRAQYSCIGDEYHQYGECNANHERDDDVRAWSCRLLIHASYQIPRRGRPTSRDSNECSEQPDAPNDDLTTSAGEYLLAFERIQDGYHLAHRQPGQAVQRYEGEPGDDDLLHDGKVAVHVVHVRRRSRADGGAERHARASDNEVGERDGEHEQGRAILAQCRVSGDDRYQESVHRQAHYRHYADDRGLDVVKGT